MTVFIAMLPLLHTCCLWRLASSHKHRNCFRLEGNAFFIRNVHFCIDTALKQADIMMCHVQDRAVSNGHLLTPCTHHVDFYSKVHVTWLHGYMIVRMAFRQRITSSLSSVTSSKFFCHCSHTYMPDFHGSHGSFTAVLISSIFCFGWASCFVIHGNYLIFGQIHFIFVTLWFLSNSSAVGVEWLLSL